MAEPELQAFALAPGAAAVACSFTPSVTVLGYGQSVIVSGADALLALKAAIAHALGERSDKGAW